MIQFMGNYIRHRNGHIEMFDCQNNFLFSADNEKEAALELKQMDDAGQFANMLQEEITKIS